ncbi:MAG TPA: protein kinase [Gemmatimonadales bacterium]|nr:protein kinase [Gemmatimonadales bacterium]
MTHRGPLTDAHDRLAAELADDYLIEEELGRGASATVFLAQDLRHGRRVALKVLHSALGAALGVERFQREIRTQARLQHPHILPLFDSGSAAGRLFYSMPYVEAGSLRDRLRRAGPLEMGPAVHLAIQVASALAYAHAAGVIHRDLKPENIMLSPTGEAILADFGIAYALEESGGELGPDSDPAGRLTETGVTVGTPTYMSPEQAAGDEILTGASDQYALAAVVYEALAGRPPFTGPNARAILARKLTTAPPPLRSVRADVPAAVEQVLLRALARQPADRYESMDAFSRALGETGVTSAVTPAGVRSLAPGRSRAPERRAVAAAVLVVLAAVAGWWTLARRGAASDPIADPTTPVLAILPFKNLGPPADQYFADGLTEELTSRLASLSGLRVISRTSAEQYRDSPKSLRQIGRELGAGYVLEGSVRWERSTGRPDQVRVTPQLIAVTDDSHLWAESIDEEVTEVFRVQSRIAERVTSALDVALRGSDRPPAAAGTSSRDAYDFYVRGGEYLARSYTRLNIEAAVDLYRKSIGLDSGFAAGWARLSQGHAALYGFYYERTAVRLDSARAALDRARRLAPGLPETHLAQAYYLAWGARDYDRALAELEAARRQDPGNPDVLGAMGQVERRRGEWGHAVDLFEEALRIDPRSAVRARDLGETYLAIRRYPEAERSLDRAIQLAPDWADPYASKAMLYLIWRGDREASRAAVTLALTRVSPGRLALALLGPDAISAAPLTADTAFATAVAAIGPGSFEGDTARYHLLAAEVAGRRGNSAGSRAHGDSARALLAGQVAAAPDDPTLLSRYGIALALAGRGEEAVRTGRRAVELLPSARDAQSAPSARVHLARIYVLLGQPAPALELLAPLVTVPSWVSPAELRSDPTWAPLRAHPLFGQLVH